MRPTPLPRRLVQCVGAALIWLPVVAGLGVIAWDVAALDAVQDPVRLEALEATLRAVEARPAPAPDPAVVSAATEATGEVWLLGGSSLRLPVPAEVTDTFRDAFAAAGLPVTVRNVAHVGYDLAALVPQLEARLRHPDVRVPDVLVVYAGHNDVNNAYHERGSPRPMRHTLGLAHAIVTGLGTWPRPGGPGWYRRARAGAWLDLWQRVGLFRVDPGFWQAWDATVTEAWDRRLDRLIAVAAARDIRVVIETPIGNLATWPHGDVHAIAALRDRADRAPDPETRRALRRRARELERFTADVRAKQGVVEAIRARAATAGVQVHDLRARWDAEGLALDDTTFSDALHFRRVGHAHHARLLAAFAAGTPAIAQALRGPPPDVLPSVPPTREP